MGDMEKSNLPFLTVGQLAKLIESSEVSPVEIAQSYLDRIQKVNPRINAYITIADEQVLLDAARAESEIANKRYLGPLHGIPFAVKDQFLTKGLTTTNGSQILSDFVPDMDATVISKLKAAGGLLLGKLNMGEFAGGGIFNYPYGIPRNPWALAHTTGGSSSGSGGATSAFLCATSLGEDTGGSIRSPSSFCGLTGLRPSRGRVSRYGMFSAIWSMDTPGPITRNVEDCAITLQAIAGADPMDRHTEPILVPDYRQYLTGEIKGLRIGIVKELLLDDYIDPQVKTSIVRATQKLEELGAIVEEVSIPLMKNAMSYLIQIPHTVTEMSAIYDNFVRTKLGEYNHDVQVNLLLGKILPAQIYYKAQKLRGLLREQTKNILRKFDLLVAQTDSEPAPLLTSGHMPLSKKEIIDKISRPIFSTVGFALVGLPAISVPCGFADVKGTKLPIGLQIAGRPFAESTVLRAAFAYEQATEWHKKSPPI